MIIKPIIKGFQKTSLIDYPDKISSVIFMAGCNFRCPFCYNKDLVLNSPNLEEIPEQDIIHYLSGKTKWVDGVVICGGEPTIYDLKDLLKKIKKLGLLIKLDTNGSNPEVIKQLIDEKLIDYISIDIKNSFEKYEESTRVNVNIKKIQETIDIIKNSKINHEFRTTVLPRLHTKEDLIEIAKTLKGGKKYFLQQFIPRTTIDKEFEKEKTFNTAELQNIKEECKKYIKTEIRNVPNS